MVEGGSLNHAEISGKLKKNWKVLRNIIRDNEADDEQDLHHNDDDHHDVLYHFSGKVFGELDDHSNVRENKAHKTD
jgi:hypothetical protein